MPVFSLTKRHLRRLPLTTRSAGASPRGEAFFSVCCAAVPCGYKSLPPGWKLCYTVARRVCFANIAGDHDSGGRSLRVAVCKSWMPSATTHPPRGGPPSLTREGRRMPLVGRGHCGTWLVAPQQSLCHSEEGKKARRRISKNARSIFRRKTNVDCRSWIAFSSTRRCREPPPRGSQGLVAQPFAKCAFFCRGDH